VLPYVDQLVPKMNELMPYLPVIMKYKKQILPITPKLMPYMDQLMANLPFLMESPTRFQFSCCLHVDFISIYKYNINNVFIINDL